jgi:formylglycine-generating enzyme
MSEMMKSCWGWTVALSTMASGCALVAGIDKDYHPLGEGGAGTSSSSGGGGSGTGMVGVLPNCAGLMPNCGSKGDENCCASTVVPGGTYNRGSDSSFPATVSDFRLDRFEITVGRFRAFVAAYPRSKPEAGAGAHPLIDGSGWDAAWDGNLPADLKGAMVQCNSPYRTWTNTPSANENLPMNCITWYEAFAFCAWVGGRLPTEAEWNYAAAGESEHRAYPWGSAAPDAAHAVYDCTGDGSTSGFCAFTDILKVGSKPAGDGRWGQADLAGSMWEWTLDGYGSYPNPSPKICTNCANLEDATLRVIRGGSWNGGASNLLSYGRDFSAPTGRSYGYGARCARTP